MIDLIRALLVVIEEGSINRAALRLRLSQPALSRQMKALEEQIGGRLLERETGGVKPTNLCHTLMKSMRPLMEAYDLNLANLRRQARGERSELRVGYLISAAQSILTPALTRLRKAHPDVKLLLHDLSPREQIDGLRAGELDLALIGQEGSVAASEFHSTKLGSFRVCAALSDSDPLASKTRITLKDLKGRDFIGIDEHHMPGRNRWLTSLCRTAGFKPRFAAIVDGITNVLSLVVSESAVTLLPDYFLQFQHPGVTFVPISDEQARWDFIVLTQRGRTSTAARTLLEALKQVVAKDK
ncbi:LysR family transcriptional regulator [Phragmitibacter flavus]|uniref:LysR family transcriptional regulator n=1 Tax=Phragmitibacter flavus TaxID=2576071 RepID=A0A5R8KAZ5_9BACT|nr:LysR family transcriptional regulator [Phragmitibacter flavus]TLD69483.1 LysR family transcriptional regulator [Phragmitibacter flavus]